LNDKFSEDKLYAQFVDSVTAVTGDTITEADEAQVIVL
jgi:hypothetical protein